ncbi:sensor histidine kinase [Pelomonas sp. APW6]|uniref:histidine kinase n=1 Tax=Roseateles subflavus TaxID=3053353 RepID=A0ABT7LP82_9BURK|nr:sensor histidine kinase [Pelomonas sp. APW6]MDL5034686.1 sensor histidine kinase [Pelomonas sp. APW6]
MSRPVAPVLTSLRSLKQRLLLLTLVTAGLTLVAAGVMLSAIFRDHVRQQFIERQSAELDQILAHLEVDAQGRPVLDAGSLSDPRWTRPRSGLYWQVDAGGLGGQAGLLRSRSLWDEQLTAPQDLPGDGELHVHEVSGPGEVPLLLIERRLRLDSAPVPWRVMVAAETAPLVQAAERFNRALGAALLGLLLLLVTGALLQVAVGLAPLGRLREALAALRDGRTRHLDGRWPEEVQPLVDDLNGVLDRQAAMLERARAQAGNLAHALKTPLTVMAQGAAAAQASSPSANQAVQTLAPLVSEQVQLARRHIDWHLARSRAAAAVGIVGLQAPLRSGVEGLVRVMQRVHAARGVSMTVEADADLVFAGEAQDLQEMLGNLLDNACKAARQRVVVHAVRAGRQLRVTVDDDGPGIPADRQAEALRRGARLDESTPGSGLGLAIVQELAALYGGSLALGSSALGGLQATLVLPAA